MRVSTRVRVLAGASLASLLLSGSIAYAQETPEETAVDETDRRLDSVVVTGFRDSSLKHWTSRKSRLGSSTQSLQKTLLHSLT